MVARLNNSADDRIRFGMAMTRNGQA